MYMFSILVLLILQSQCADWTISPYKETGNFDPSKKILMVATQNLVPTTGYSFTWWNACRDAAAKYPAYQCLFVAAGFANGTRFPSDYDVLNYYNTRFFQNSSIKPNLFHVVNSDLLTTTEQLIAPANPSIWFTTNRFRQNNATSNLAGFKIAQDEEGFVAGIAAGLATKSFVVGVVLPTPWGSLRIIGQSFMKGARYACPSCTIYITYCVDWNDPNQGAAAAQKLISLGADVISGVGGGSSEGALYYAASVGVWVFCMEVDQSSGIFSNKSDPASNYYLGSVVISIYEPIYSAFELSILGKYSYQNRYLGVASGSIKRLRPNSTIAATLLNTTVKFYDTVASTNFGAIILVDTVDNIIDQLIVRLGLGVTQTKLRASYYDGVKSFGNGTWSTLDYVKISPPPIAGHSQTSLLNNQFIVFGGQLYSGSYSNVAWSYNYLNLEWNVITPNVSAGSVIPPSLSNHAAVWQNSTSLLWLFGGKRSAQSVSSDIYTLNSKLSIWKKIDIIGTSPTPRYLTASAILNEKLFVYGGIDGSNTVLKDFWSFSLNTLTWTQLLSMGPDALSGASLTVVNGTELILFGHNSFDRSSPTPRLWRYSTVSNTWTLISPDGTAPTSFTSGSAVLLDHRRILYLGGLASTSGVPQSQSFIYNSGINSWTNFTALNLPTESYAHTAVTWNATAENVYQGWGFFYQNPTYAEMTRFWLDSPVDGVAVTLFGGIQKTGLSNGLLIIYPADEPPSQYPSFISDGIRYACYVFSVIGIICAIVLSVLTFVYFENPYFKKASPYFLYLYNLGATIIFIGLILFNVGGLNLAACSAAVWMVSTGCIILYAPIVVKNYRIYRIFTARYRITGLDNSKLLSVVGVCVLLNCIPLVLFQTVGGGFVAQSLTIGSEVWPVCSSNAGLWIWILIAPMIALLLFGLFLSFQTRHVFSAYNESQLINISVYLTILSMLILVPLALTINLPPTHHLLLTLVGSFTVISILGINFGPKLINIWFGGDQMVEMSKHSEKSKESEDYSDAIFCRSCMRPMDNEKESQASVSAKKSGFATDKMSSNVKSIQKSKSTTEEAFSLKMNSLDELHHEQMDKLFDEEYQDYLKIRRGEKVPNDGSKDIDYKLRDWAMKLGNIKQIDDLVVSFNDNQVSVESVPKDLSGSMKEIDLKPSNSFFKDGVPESLKNLRIKYRKDGFEILENF